MTSFRRFLADVRLILGLATLWAGHASVAQAADLETVEMAINCVGRCAAFYRVCVNTTHDYEGCAADREACKDLCDEQTCEPGEPDCCQGQPTCW